MSETVACAWVPSPEHVDPTHPEHPRRLEGLRPLVDHPGDLPLAWLAVDPAPRERITLVHPPTYLDALEAACARGPAVIDYAPTFVTPASYQAALNAVGGALACLDALLAGQARRAFAFIRPPGHHAEPTRAMGFCLLNNAAVVAANAIAQGLRVLIVDLDAHHGNGTQAYAWEEPACAYFSLHQGGIYPGSGWPEEAPHARGRIVNLPLPAHTGDVAYLHAWDTLLAPLAERFAPDLLVVSLGFDAHWQDPLTTLGLSAQGYGRLLERLTAFADAHTGGRILCLLEGGYHPPAVTASARACLHALAGLPLPPDPLGPSPYPEPDLTPTVNALRDLHGLS